MKVAICLPTGHEIPARSALCLSALTAYMKAKVPEISVGLLHYETPYIAMSRTELAKAALAEDFDALMWIDSDQTFPPEALLRLLEHGLPIVGATYRSRQPPHRYMLPLIGPDAPEGNFANVAYLPGGFTLVRSEVYHQLPFPYYRADYGLDPERPQAFIGEDIYFGMKAREAGFAVKCDLALSQEIGHIIAVELNAGNMWMTGADDDAAG